MKANQLWRLAFIAGLAFSAACDDPSTFDGEAHLIVRFTPSLTGSFTARLDGRTYDDAGQVAINLADLGATYEITGSFTGGSLGIAFSTSTMSGVESGSITSVSGPSPSFTGCGINYFTTNSASQTYRMQFRLTGTTALVCRAG